MKWRDHPDRRRGVPARVRRFIQQRDRGVCYLCHHAGGEMHVDHVINHKRWLDEQRPGNPDDPSNLALAHAKPCPTCSRDCHADKTRGEANAAIQRIAAKQYRPQPGLHPGLID